MVRKKKHIIIQRDYINRNATYLKFHYKMPLTLYVEQIIIWNYKFLRWSTSKKNYLNTFITAILDGLKGKLRKRRLY